jgi:hypothetical protein
MYLYYEFLSDYFHISSRVVWCPGQNIRIAPLFFLHGCLRRLKTNGLIGLTPEIDCDQTAMGLPPVTSVSLIAN